MIFLIGEVIGLVQTGVAAYQEHRARRKARKRARREAAQAQLDQERGYRVRGDVAVFSEETLGMNGGPVPFPRKPFVPPTGLLAGPGQPPETSLEDFYMPAGVGLPIVGPVARGILPRVIPRVVGPAVRAGRAAWAAAKIAAAKAAGRIPKLSKRALIELGATAVGIGLWAVNGEVVQESRRRMNPLNPRALGRAQRRVCAFARFATQSYAIRGLVRRRSRRGPCARKTKCR